VDHRGKQWVNKCIAKLTGSNDTASTKWAGHATTISLLKQKVLMGGGEILTQPLTAY